MSRTIFSCRACGMKLANRPESGVLHTSAARFIEPVDGAMIVTLRCPGCGQTRTVRTQRMALD